MKERAVRFCQCTNLSEKANSVAHLKAFQLKSLISLRRKWFQDVTWLQMLFLRTFCSSMPSDTIRTEILHWAEGEVGGSSGPKAALSPKRYSEMNICVTLALISVYLTAHFKSNADGCLSQTYTSLDVFFFSSSFFHIASAYLLAHAFAPWTPFAINIFICKHSVSAGEWSDWHWKANNAACLPLL